MLVVAGTQVNTSWRSNARRGLLPFFRFVSPLQMNIFLPFACRFWLLRAVHCAFLFKENVTMQASWVLAYTFLLRKGLRSNCRCDIAVRSHWSSSYCRNLCWRICGCCVSRRSCVHGRFNVIVDQGVPPNPVHHCTLFWRWKETMISPLIQISKSNMLFIRL